MAVVHPVRRTTGQTRNQHGLAAPGWRVCDALSRADRDYAGNDHRHYGAVAGAPLLFRDLIDHALPEHDATRLNWLALGMIVVPLVNGAMGVVQRWLAAQIGEGVISDLRTSLFATCSGCRFAFSPIRARAS